MAVRISERVSEFHSALIRAGLEGKTVLREDIERLMMERWQISVATTRFYIDTGRTLKLWELTDPKARENSKKIPNGTAVPAGLVILGR